MRTSSTRSGRPSGTRPPGGATRGVALVTPSPIIPARAIHTSQDVGVDGDESSLYDIFCPPRIDFASKPGFCINEDEYPLPAMEGEREIKTGGTLLSWQKPG